jgi:hypothetical protein
MNEETLFYKTIQDIFIGAKIEGQGGFANLTKIKSKYYEKMEKLLKKDIEEVLKKHPAFRDELFDKLYLFFSRCFTESGSICFKTDDKDNALFWKTQPLYYIKTDRIFRSMSVEFNGLKFYFDASEIENKKNNEKRNLIYKLKEMKEDKTMKKKKFITQLDTST